MPNMKLSWLILFGLTVVFFSVDAAIVAGQRPSLSTISQRLDALENDLASLQDQVTTLEAQVATLAFAPIIPTSIPITRPQQLLMAAITTWAPPQKMTTSLRPKDKTASSALTFRISQRRVRTIAMTENSNGLGHLISIGE